jgi:hypothetical protein
MSPPFFAPRNFPPVSSDLPIAWRCACSIPRRVLRFRPSDLYARAAYCVVVVSACGGDQCHGLAWWWRSRRWRRIRRQRVRGHRLLWYGRPSRGRFGFGFGFGPWAYCLEPYYDYYGLYAYPYYPYYLCYAYGPYICDPCGYRPYAYDPDPPEKGARRASYSPGGDQPATRSAYVADGQWHHFGRR